MKCPTCEAEITKVNVQCRSGNLSFEDMYDKCCQHVIARGKQCSNPMRGVTTLV